MALTRIHPQSRFNKRTRNATQNRGKWVVISEITTYRYYAESSWSKIPIFAENAEMVVSLRVSVNSAQMGHLDCDIYYVVVALIRG